MGKPPLVPESLVELVRDGRVVPFIGSGVSLGVKSGLFPTWKGLLSELADKLQREAKQLDAESIRIKLQKNELFAAAEEAFVELGKHRFHKFMRERFGVAPPPEANLAVPNAVWSLRPRLVLTTNYDCVLNWSRPESKQVLNHQWAELAQLDTYPSRDYPWVWHLHGHVNQLDSLILAPHQYQRLYAGQPGAAEEYSAALACLCDAIRHRPLLFVGFGLADPYVMSHLREVLKTARDSLPPSYALMKAGDTDEISVWRQFNVQVITYDDHNDAGPDGVSLLDLLSHLAKQAGLTQSQQSLVNEPLQTPALALSGATQGFEVVTEQCSEEQAIPPSFGTSEPFPEFPDSPNPPGSTNSNSNADHPPPVHSYSGLHCIRNQHSVSKSSLLQDFELCKKGTVNNPISKHWADADGSSIAAKVEKCDGFHVLTIKFTNRSKWPPNVAIHPQNLTPRKRVAGQNSLFFIARKVGEYWDNRKISISIRVIDENLRHWSYVENPLNPDLLCSVLGKSGKWETIEVKLADKQHWKLWDSDGNRDDPPKDGPDFKWIVGIVITVDRYPSNAAGNRAGKIQIAKLGFDRPTPISSRPSKPR